MAFFTLIKLIKKHTLNKDIIRIFLAFQMMVLIGLGALSFWQGDRFSIVFYPLVLILINDIVFNKKDKNSKVIPS
jgi:hypothetical protein